MNIPDHRKYFLIGDQLIVAPLFAVKEYRQSPHLFKEISEEDGQALINYGAEHIGRNYSAADCGGFVTLDDRIDFYSTVRK